MFIHVLFKFIDHPYCFEFFDISSVSLSLESIIVELLTLEEACCLLFFIFLLFLHWDLCIWGQVIDCSFNQLYSFKVFSVSAGMGSDRTEVQFFTIGLVV
jgi:hypothetical protein